MADMQRQKVILNKLAIVLSVNQGEGWLIVDHHRKWVDKNRAE